jgi:nicotinic acid phosphoribosyltransferase
MVSKRVRVVFRHRIKIHIEGPLTYVGSFEVSVLAHVALRMLAAIFLASQ